MLSQTFAVRDFDLDVGFCLTLLGCFGSPLHGMTLLGHFCSPLHGFTLLGCVGSPLHGLYDFFHNQGDIWLLDVYIVVVSMASKLILLQL